MCQKFPGDLLTCYARVIKSYFVGGVRACVRACVCACVCHSVRQMASMTGDSGDTVCLRARVCV